MTVLEPALNRPSNYLRCRMSEPGKRCIPEVGSEVFTARSRRESDAAWARARAGGPIVKTGDDDGLWVLTRYEEVCAAFRDWELYSSARTSPEYAAITVAKAPVELLVPQELDPPEWFPVRRILARLLSPAAINELRPRVRYWINVHLDRVVASGHCDFVTDLTVPVPACVTMEFLGFPEEEWLPLAGVFHDISGYPSGHPVREAAIARLADVHAASRRELDARRITPRSDAISAIALHEIDGQRADVELMALLVTQVMGGGVDTTTALTSAALAHLGGDVELRERLRLQPALMETATEEFLRMYPPARTFARTVTADSELSGCPITQGERVVLSMISANYDDRIFEEPDVFDADRFPNRHVSFGMGIHRCPGSHLARIMFTEMISAVLERMPDYKLVDGGVEEYPYWSSIGGLAHLPVTFTPY